MAMTALVKAELSRLAVSTLSQRKAEVAVLLRCAGDVQLTGGRLVVAADLDTASVARRLRRTLAEVYGYTSGLSVRPNSSTPEQLRYLVRIARHGEALARQTGLVDSRGRPIRGLPPAIVGGGPGAAEAAWRGAFLARGSLTEPGRSTCLEVSCPSTETAMALAGAARRLGIPAKARDLNGTDHVQIRDRDAIPVLLTRIGATAAAQAWTERLTGPRAQVTAHRLANFDQANLRRSTQAAAAVSARVHRALDILSSDAPTHLLAAGRLRLQHPDASLDELGQRADPPMTKDAIAGRIRRLLTRADQLAHTLGIPDTSSVPEPALTDQAARTGNPLGP